MALTIPLLLLILGGVSFWLLVESKVLWAFKILIISLFCLFTVSFFSSLSTFLGWGAMERELPETVTIHSVMVKEPNIILNDKGRIYLLLDSNRSIYTNRIINIFGYYSKKSEPRLFAIPYSRQLHEELQKNVIPQTQKGQAVTGKLLKGKSGGGKPGNGQPGEGKGNGNGKNGQGKGNGEGKGGGSESLEQEYHFYQLQPSDIRPKTYKL